MSGKAETRANPEGKAPEGQRPQRPQRRQPQQGAAAAGGNLPQTAGNAQWRPSDAAVDLIKTIYGGLAQLTARDKGFVLANLQANFWPGWQPPSKTKSSKGANQAPPKEENKAAAASNEAKELKEVEREIRAYRRDHPEGNLPDGLYQRRQRLLAAVLALKGRPPRGPTDNNSASN